MAHDLCVPPRALRRGPRTPSAPRGSSGESCHRADRRRTTNGCLDWLRTDREGRRTAEIARDRVTAGEWRVEEHFVGSFFDQSRALIVLDSWSRVRPSNSAGRSNGVPCSVLVRVIALQVGIAPRRPWWRPRLREHLARRQREKCDKRCSMSNHLQSPVLERGPSPHRGDVGSIIRDSRGARAFNFLRTLKPWPRPNSSRHAVRTVEGGTWRWETSSPRITASGGFFCLPWM